MRIFAATVTAGPFGRGFGGNESAGNPGASESETTEFSEVWRRLESIKEEKLCLGRRPVAQEIGNRLLHCNNSYANHAFPRAKLLQKPMRHIEEMAPTRELSGRSGTTIPAPAL
jgi:hypothetical protein